MSRHMHVQEGDVILYHDIITERRKKKNNSIITPTSSTHDTEYFHSRALLISSIFSGQQQGAFGYCKSGCIIKENFCATILNNTTCSVPLSHPSFLSSSSEASHSHTLIIFFCFFLKMVIMVLKCFIKIKKVLCVIALLQRRESLSCDFSCNISY